MIRKRSPSRPLVPLIIGVNVLVYLSWHWPIYFEPTMMLEHFLVSWTALLEGRIWTLITSVFSHNMFFHIFLNMYVLLQFGSILEAVLGARRFLFFYLTAGVVGSLSHSVVSAWLLGDPDLAALGASGAISGVILTFSLIFPREKILIFGLIPLPAFWGAVLLVVADVWGLVAQTQGGSLPIGHGAHLGGAITGIFYYLFFLRGRI